MNKITYKKSGVNIFKADKFVEGINSMLGEREGSKVSAFSSIFELSKILKKYKNPALLSSTDGVGTKLLLAQRCNVHMGVGIDLVAMNVNDIVSLGARPLFFLDYIACGKVKTKVLLSVVKGINCGLEQSECSLLGGETAEMPGMYKNDEYDLAGFCVGIVDKNNVIDGSRIKKDDVIIGLESSGLHSNGFSLVRMVFGKSHIKKYSRELLKPTRIYVKPILSLLSKFNRNSFVVKGIAHVTGGAFYNKVTKILPLGLGMSVRRNSWEIPKIFKLIKKEGKVSEREMYTVFNMGIGMMLVVDKKHVNKVLTHLNGYCKTHVIGSIVKSNRKMTLA